MSEIAFHSEVGAPGRYDLLYVSVLDGDAPEQALDLPGAVKNAETLAASGSPLAQFLLGHMLLSGQGMARDEAAAFRWFSLAAQSGRADAINMVGRCHACGWGVPVDRGEAARWYRRAVDKQNAWAMFNLGELMLAGDGVARDGGGALSLFVRSARLGNAKAMNMIGQIREDGADSRRRFASAVRWYRRAAERGCFRGQHNLARFLARAGQMDAAVEWLRASFSVAPPEFCREVGRGLISHPDMRLQNVGREGLARANAI